MLRRETETLVDRSSIDAINAEAWSINRTDPRKGIELSLQALAYAEQSDYRKGKAYALTNLGACKVWLGDYEESLDHSFAALQMLSEDGDKKQMAVALYSIFCVFYFLSDFESALKYILECYRIADETGDLTGKANALNGIGTAYYTTGENQKAVERLNEGLQIAVAIGDEQIQAKILDGLGTAHFNLENYEEALRIKFACLELVKRLGIKQIHSYALDGIGGAYVKLERFEEAIPYYEDSLRLRREIGFRAGEAETLLHLGEVNFALGKKEQTLCYLEEALVLSREVDAKGVVYRVHKALSDLYESMNETALQIDHLKKYYELKEVFNSLKQSQKQRSLEMQFRVERVEQEKDLLKKKNSELESVFKDVVLLSEIGQRITSSLSVEEINQIIYETLNTMMDAPSFGVGIYNREKNIIAFPGYIEDGNLLDNAEYDASDMNRLAPVCFQKEQEILIHDLEAELSNFVPVKMAPKAGRHVTSLIYLPIKIHGIKRGVITVQSFKKNAYTEHHVNLLRNLGTYAGIALENARLYEGLEEMVQERSQEVIRQKEEIERSYYNTQLLSEIGQQITSTLNIETIFNQLYENVNKLMPAECFGVRIYRPEANVIDYKYEVEKGEVYAEVISVSMDNDDNYSVWCVKNREVIFLNDNMNEYHKYTKKIVVPSGEMPHSLIFYPMMIADKVIGVITVQSFTKFAYSPYHIDILKTLGTYTAIALENANLYESMEDKVKERTVEVVLQKEEIERNHRDTELLSTIGKDITSSLSVEAINQKVFQTLNTMMDAPSFGIGLFQSRDNTLVFPGYIEEGLSEEVVYDIEDNRLACLCFRKEMEVLIHDYDQEISQYTGHSSKALVGLRPSSVLYLPLKTKDKKIGVITAQSFIKNAYSDYHLNLLRNLAVYVAIALDNASLYESLEEKVKERTDEIRIAYENTRLLSQIQKDITSSLSIETIISRVYENVNTLMDASAFGIGIYDPEKRLILMPGFIENGIPMEDFSYSIDDPNRLAVNCFMNQREIFINDFSVEYVHFIKGMQQPVSGKDASSIIYIPLISKGKAIGVITVQSFEKDAYTEYHLDILRNLAVSTAIAIENAMLYENLELKVKERTAEVVKQKEVIEEKNKHITDSIVYAKRIQQAILPPEDVFKTHLQNSFVLYKPKDIVSGDFYWLERKGNKILFAVVDCTGHGVPGAFMSIIGYNGLNQIVNEYNVTQPAEILNHLNKIISTTLKQRADESKIRDGMDLSVCAIDLDSNTLEYAGANNPIFIVRNGEVIEVKADKQPIGNFVGEDDFRFTNKDLTIFPNDKIYLFSDGYADQFGGPHGKKLKYTVFRELLLANCHRPMEEQKMILDRMFEGWRGDLEQIDDVCVIGVGV